MSFYNKSPTIACRYISCVQVPELADNNKKIANLGFKGQKYILGGTTHVSQYLLYSKLEYEMLTHVIKYFKLDSNVTADFGGTCDKQIKSERYELPTILSMMMGANQDSVKTILELIVKSAKQQANLTWNVVSTIKKIHTNKVYEEVLFLYASNIISNKNHPERDELLGRLFEYSGKSSDIRRLRSRLFEKSLDLPITSEDIDLSPNSLKRIRELIINHESKKGKTA